MYSAIFFHSTTSLPFKNKSPICAPCETTPNLLKTKIVRMRSPKRSKLFETGISRGSTVSQGRGRGFNTRYFYPAKTAILPRSVASLPTFSSACLSCDCCL